LQERDIDCHFIGDVGSRGQSTLSSPINPSTLGQGGDPLRSRLQDPAIQPFWRLGPTVELTEFSVTLIVGLSRVGKSLQDIRELRMVGARCARLSYYYYYLVKSPTWLISFRLLPPFVSKQQVDRNIILIRNNRLPVNQLPIRIRRPSNQLLPKVHNRPGCKPIALAKLPAPARANSIRATDNIIDRGAAGGRAGNGVLAARGGGDLGVDAEGDNAGGVGGVAGTGEGLDDLGLDFSHGGDGVGWGGDGHGGDDAEEDGAVPHGFGGCVCCF
jgi:hypothetical protein